MEMLTSVVVGKTLAYTSINFHNEKKELVARGTHTKYDFFAEALQDAYARQHRYVTLAWKDPNNIVEELSPKPEKSS